MFTSTSWHHFAGDHQHHHARWHQHLADPGRVHRRSESPAVDGQSATINYTVSGRGILQTLNDYVNQSRGPNGIFTAESANATSTEKDLTAQIANQNLILAARKTTLQAQFTAMEVALASLQSQGAALSSSLGVATTTAAANSASSSSSTSA